LCRAGQGADLATVIADQDRRRQADDFARLLQLLENVGAGIGRT